MNTATLTDAQLRMNVANAELIDLLEMHNEPALDGDNFRYACLECGALELEDDPETYEIEVCDACWHKDHFDCEVCNGEFDNDDMHDKHKGLCCDCGDERESDELAEKIVEIKEEIDDILDSWDGDDNELEKFQKALAALKRIK